MQKQRGNPWYVIAIAVRQPRSSLAPLFPKRALCVLRAQTRGQLRCRNREISDGVSLTQRSASARAILRHQHPRRSGKPTGKCGRAHEARQWRQETRRDKGSGLHSAGPKGEGSRSPLAAPVAYLSSRAVVITDLNRVSTLRTEGRQAPRRLHPRRAPPLVRLVLPGPIAVAAHCTRRTRTDTRMRGASAELAHCICCLGMFRRGCSGGDDGGVARDLSLGWNCCAAPK